MRRRSLLALFSLYFKERQARHASPSALCGLERTLPRFLALLRRRRVFDVRRMSEADVVAFAASMRHERTQKGEPFSTATQAAALSVVRRFCAWLHERRLILVDPSAAVHLPKVARLPRNVLSLTQARRLMAAPDPYSPRGQRNRAILEVLYGTGLRVNEATRLDLRDVDLGQGTLLVRNGKGRKDRVVPLVGRAAAALERYLREGRPLLSRDRDDDGALFLSERSGRRLGGPQILGVVRELSRALGFRATPHALRHACATHLLKGGADVRQVQELLGHRSIDTTALYTRVAIEDLREAVTKAWPRPRRKR